MKPHPTDRVSLSFGVLFLMVVLGWLFAAQLGIGLPTAGWFLAGGLILFGVLGLIGSIRPRKRAEPVSPASAPSSLDDLGADPEPW